MYKEKVTADFAENDLIRVEWYNDGEGWCGDYNPEDPEDQNLLRFDVSIKRDGKWQEVEDASYCTRMPADTYPDILKAALRMLLKEYTEALRSNPECSVKKLGEAMSWISPDWFVPMVNESVIKEGIRKGVIKFVLDPNGDGKTGTVCQIGENWFYFGGLTAEQSSPDEYVENVPEEDIVREVLETVLSFKTSGKELEDEYIYYALYLKEKLSETHRKTLILAEIPVCGALKVLDVKTKRVLHETMPGDPGDISPDVAMLEVVSVYAAGDQTVVEVLA